PGVASPAASRPAMSASSGGGSGTDVTARLWTRDGCSGLINISTRTRPRSPRSHQARWDGPWLFGSTDVSGASVPWVVRMPSIAAPTPAHGSPCATYQTHTHGA